MKHDQLEKFCLQELEAYRKFKTSKKILDFKEWFYKNSKTFTTVDEKLSEKLSLINNCQIKDCYRNAWISCLGRSELKYYEGFIMTCGIPIQHAWLVNADGMVIDPTLIINGERMKEQLLKNYKIKESSNKKSRLSEEYFGLEIPIDFVNKMSFKHKITGEWVFRYYYEKICPKLDQVEEIKN